MASSIRRAVSTKLKAGENVTAFADNVAAILKEQDQAGREKQQHYTCHAQNLLSFLQ
jgi:hypothetical protein